MQNEVITLGEREYTLTELPLRKASAFRKELRSIFSEIVDLLEGGPKTELSDGMAVANLIRSVSDTVLNSVDTAMDLVFTYSEDVAADREYVEDNAVGSQVVDAFLAVLLLSFPFLVSERGRKLTQGLAALGSNTNRT